MMKNHNSKFVLIAVCAMTILSLCACRVETKTESVPEAEGSGKKALNIRVEPMSKQEIKDVANQAIDTTAKAAGTAKDAAKTAVHNVESVGKAVTTLSGTMKNLHKQGDARETSDTK